MSTPFLSAHWRKLIMANYVVDAQFLRPWLPAGTEPDTWNGRHYLSLVGFLFDDTRLKGWRIPFHTRFEEVNLRMYVRCKMPESVFLAEGSEVNVWQKFRLR